MNKSEYNPEIHHRKSIRLKGHDYAGGGLYFVTICAHRDFIAATNGHPFGVGARLVLPLNEATKMSQEDGATKISQEDGATRMSQKDGATRMSPVREIIKEEMQHTADLLPWMQWNEYAIMPDHFHALIELQGGHGKLGDVVGGFKAGVSRNLRRRGGILPAQTLPSGILPAQTLPSGILPAQTPSAQNEMPIWHRNYYEMIVRNAEMERNIAGYIRMNPWKLIVAGSFEGNSFQCIGNPSLLNFPKVGVLCSRRVPMGTDLNPPECENVFISGFHSPPEREILAVLLERKARVICCPAWGIDLMRIPKEWLLALEENRMMIMQIRSELAGNLASAEERNRFVLKHADEIWLPHVTPGGMLDRLVGMNFK